MQRIIGVCLMAGLMAGCGSDDPTGPASAQAFRGCATVQTTSLGSSVSGSLSNSDCTFQALGGFQDSFVDYYELTVSSARDVTISLSSTQFDAVLIIFERTSAGVIDLDDDSGGGLLGTDSRIDVTLPAGTYVIAATSFDAGETGGYQLLIN